MAAQDKRSDLIGAPNQLKNDQPNENPAEIRTGRYRHFKGGEYQVIGIARHSETLEEFVVYQALYGEKELWIRPKENFREKVIFEGNERIRFEFLGKDSIPR
jgi:cyclomaltodextrinase / maltogenic alpha-amylase / neopullulanase